MRAHDDEQCPRGSRGLMMSASTNEGEGVDCVETARVTDGEALVMFGASG